MNKRQKAKELIEEQSELEIFERISKKDSMHFEIREHYGINPIRISIPRRYNEMFIEAFKKVQEDIENQLNDLGL